MHTCVRCGVASLCGLHALNQNCVQCVHTLTHSHLYSIWTSLLRPLTTKSECSPRMLARHAMEPDMRCISALPAAFFISVLMLCTHIPYTFCSNTVCQAHAYKSWHCYLDILTCMVGPAVPAVAPCASKRCCGKCLTRRPSIRRAWPFTVCLILPMRRSLQNWLNMA